MTLARHLTLHPRRSAKYETDKEVQRKENGRLSILMSQVPLGLGASHDLSSISIISDCDIVLFVARGVKFRAGAVSEHRGAELLRL